MTQGDMSVWATIVAFFKHVPLILYLIANFLIVVVIAVKYGRKPVNDFLSNRRRTIEEKLKETKNLLDQAQVLKATYEKKLAGLDQEIEAFRKKIVDETEKEKAKIIAEATQFASKMKDQARLTYEQELKETKNKIKENITGLTVEAAGKLIAEKMSKADHEKMVEDFITKLRSLN
ncbi:MAG TPA: ATP synthase F0 subunit B [Syntrophorhabdaceae bacterium]|nr:ATP synthase F0 subunit B [Syntrophorhabdaceae bacterium]